MVLRRKKERDVVGVLGSRWSCQNNEAMGDWYRGVKLEDGGECNDVLIGRANGGVICSRETGDQTKTEDRETEGVRIAVGAKKRREVIRVVLEARDGFRNVIDSSGEGCNRNGATVDR